MPDCRYQRHVTKAPRAAIAALTLSLLAPALVIAERPAPGMFLVATDEVRGPFFRETVVLLLHYDAAGAQGLVMNRPMQAAPAEILPDLDGIEDYEGTLYWGGPVQITSVRALLRTEDPPRGAVHIVDEVYLVPPDAGMPASAVDASSLRYFLGYAGWAAGQLDGELIGQSWHVLRASGDLVFDSDTAGIWRRMQPPQAIRAARPSGLQAVELATDPPAVPSAAPALPLLRAAPGARRY